MLLSGCGIKKTIVKVEWGPCIQYVVAGEKYYDLDDMSDKDEWPCVRQVGFRADGTMVWRKDK